MKIYVHIFSYIYVFFTYMFISFMYIYIDRTVFLFIFKTILTERHSCFLTFFFLSEVDVRFGFFILFHIFLPRPPFHFPPLPLTSFHPFSLVRASYPCEDGVNKYGIKSLMIYIHATPIWFPNASSSMIPKLQKL